MFNKILRRIKKQDKEESCKQAAYKPDHLYDLKNLILDLSCDSFTYEEKYLIYTYMYLQEGLITDKRLIELLLALQEYKNRGLTINKDIIIEYHHS